MTTLVLRRTCRAEWSRLWTVRSSWWFSLATAAGILGLGVVLGVDVAEAPASELPDGSAWTGATILGIFALYGLLAHAVVAVTSDHTTGGIVPTLQATPRRGVLAAARTLVVVGFCALFGAVVVTGACLIVRAIVPELGIPAGEGVRVMSGVAAAYGLSCLVAVGLALLLRSMPGALVSVLALMLVLPPLFAELPFGWSQDLAQVLPGSAAIMLLVGESLVPMTEATAWTTLALWAVGAVAAGVARLVRSDANR